ncbi:outer membrane lipoprotein chaperone LolA [Mangrovimicrobium sediminis]|uniref:Outer-membrane lipoprotein carrier protein n=1 Tax=Mangrovimicrobium sediminis TaxID=2562682 RepID=A0A4Z0M708_9GAMM|nr:outer membrane lipoprotein chaperone LolA [Haliea sp. SAOS-164]TGD75284.1 outer membrane lipoprotein chaperone LolA [Haliea sp. SAOS-164]
MYKYLLLAALALCLFVGIARSEEAQDASAQLAGQLDALHTLAGQFSQSRLQAGPSGELSHSSGSFRLLRPSFFAWDIENPDSQLVITDGEYLWHYDRDLETVTRRPLRSEQTATPLQVLAGDRDALRERYTVSATGRGRFQLTPRGEDTAFRQLTLVFAEGQLAGMEILDNLGQQLLIEFSELSSPPLTPEDFHFVPPEGVDLLYHER